MNMTTLSISGRHSRTNTNFGNEIDDNVQTLYSVLLKYITASNGRQEINKYIN